VDGQVLKVHDNRHVDQLRVPTQFAGARSDTGTLPWSSRAPNVARNAQAAVASHRQATQVVEAGIRALSILVPVSLRELAKCVTAPSFVSTSSAAESTEVLPTQAALQ